MDEWFDTVDEADRVVGRARRAECHRNPALVHRAAHVVVFSTDGRVLLQKRSAAKDLEPGKWDTAVGGHLALGEDYETGVRREMAEELGLAARLPLERLFDLRFRDAVQSENIRVFRLVYDGPFRPDPAEVDEVRFWTACELRNALGTGVLTPSLEIELARLFAGGWLPR